ncbi:MAG TPA: rhamnulokinase family protein [Acidimicrobiales bacterium]|nr:rhamnulokinase family protein [Acidimicrobiales bacterium]
MPARVFAAVDLGASGGRVMAGVVDSGRVGLHEVHRFPNGPVERDGHLRWDFARLQAEVVAGLERVQGAESVGIDAWGVDYGLLDDDGNLLADPVSYRDDRTAKAVDEVHAIVPPEELYAATGAQIMPLNTVYQLAADRGGPIWPRVARVLMMPDLVAFGLTGRPGWELTIASTTGLLDVSTRQWSVDVLSRLDLSPSLFGPVEPPGQLRGRTDVGLAVTTVAAHDTASAVVAVPAVTDHFAYVSTGTWSLVGLELDRPLVTDATRRSNFTNEAGVDGTTRFLRNVAGFWLLQECMRAWGRDDGNELLEEAARLGSGGPVVDVDDPAFVPPGDMPERIARAAGTGLEPAATVRCIIDSLAFAYARTVRQAATLAHTTVDVIHMVGGGCRNDLLCQLTADAAGLPVVAGPVEATALGNVVVQGRAHGALTGSLEAIRAGIARTTHLRRYEPS